MRTRIALFLALAVAGAGTWYAIGQTQARQAALEIPALVAPADAEITEGLFQNVRLIPHLSIPELHRVMNYFASSLGVGCNHCHDLRDFSADLDDDKVTARTMLGMVQDLNQDVFGSERIACYTCHRGGTSPRKYPPAPQAEGGAQ